MKVPDILLSGNHEEIKSWRKQKMLERTIDRRNDLISNENTKNSLQINRIKTDSTDFLKSHVDKEYDSYPNW